MSEQWYYAKDGKTQGPFPFEQLKSLASSGQLSPADHVLKAGTTDWLPAAQVPELFGVPSTPPPLPPGNSGMAVPPPLPFPGQPPPASGQVMISSRQQPAQNAILMAVLSGVIWVFPVGHFLLGQKIKTAVLGIGAFMLFFSCFGILAAATLNSGAYGGVSAAFVFGQLCLSLLCLVWAVLLAFDAYLLANKIEQGHSVADWDFPVIEKIQTLFKKP